MMEEREDLIHLQNAHVTQHSTKEGKSAWKVQKNKTNEDLYDLPGHFSEKDVFAALHFARDFELIAFNSGIQFMKIEMERKILEDREKAMTVIHKLESANNMLANKLAKFIGEEE